MAVNRGLGGSVIFQRCIWRLLGLGRQCGPGVSESFFILAWLLSLFLSVLVGVHFLLFLYAKDFSQIRWLQAVDPGAIATVLFAKYRGYVIAFNRHRGFLKVVMSGVFTTAYL